MTLKLAGNRSARRYVLHRPDGIAVLHFCTICTTLVLQSRSRKDQQPILSKTAESMPPASSNLSHGQSRMPLDQARSGSGSMKLDRFDVSLNSKSARVVYLSLVSSPMRLCEFAMLSTYRWLSRVNIQEIRCVLSRFSSVSVRDHSDASRTSAWVCRSVNKQQFVALNSEEPGLRRQRNVSNISKSVETSRRETAILFEAESSLSSSLPCVAG